MTDQTQSGSLYIVATPIGNLADISRRALEILKAVDVIAAEDTRHSRKLLQHYAIDTTLLALHEHNEDSAAAQCVERLCRGESVALVSDAGTPLLSDPGFVLVRMAIEQSIPVVPVPGASALVAALSAAGIPVDRFCFEGFLPAKSAARMTVLQSMAEESRTMVFYESPHRIMESLHDMAQVFGEQREAVVARELTKTFEQFYRGTLKSVLEWLSQHAEQIKGEFVVMIKGVPQGAKGQYPGDQVLATLLAELPLKQAVALSVKITGEHKNSLYQRALAMKSADS